MISELHVAWAFTQAGQLLASGTWSDEPEVVARLGNRLVQAADIIKSWVMAAGGTCVYDVITQGIFVVPADQIHDFGRVIGQLRNYVETDMFAGIGIGIREAQDALRQAWKAQKPYAFYDEAAGADKDPDDALALDASLHEEPLGKSGHIDQLPGGIADEKKPEDFDAEQLRIGTAHEREHTNDPALAQEIAMDHLTEDSGYYLKLQGLEKAVNDGKDHWAPAETSENPGQEDGGAQNPSGVSSPDTEGSASANQGSLPPPTPQDEASNHSESSDSGGEANDGSQGDDAKQMVIKALLAIKAQAQAISQLQAASPDAFEAIKQVVQAMVAMAHSVGQDPESKESTDEESVQKAESLWKRLRLPEPKLSPKKVDMKYPDAVASPASGGGTIKDGKIKVAPVDPKDGSARPQGWNSARAGMVVGPHGSAVSSRNPSGE